MTTPVQGPPGKSAYEVAVDNGFSGTEAQWLASLKGATGPRGLTGATGPQGATGPRGLQGVPGPAGARGVAGPAGPAGSTGPRGLPGAQGVTGPTGPRGLQGVAGPRGGVGPVGPAGPAGPTGARGPQGLPTTVNGKTGASISLNAADVGALTQTLADARYLQTTASTSFVGTSGNQTIDGVKTFNQAPVVPGGKVAALDWYNVKAYGAKGDDTANDRNAIQAAIDAATAAGGGVVYLPKGTYRIGSPLLPTNATGLQLVGAGWGTSIKLNEGMNDYAIKLDGTDTRLRIADLTLDGNCMGQTAGGGVWGAGAVQCRFENVHFVGCYDWGLYLGPQTGNIFGHNNRVTNCLFDNSMGSAGIGGGIYMTSNDENWILACDFEYLGGTGAGPVAILDKAGTQFITACNFVNGGNGCISVRIQDCQSTRVTGCNFDGTAGDSIFLAASRCNIIGNTIFSPGMAGTAGVASGIHLEYAAAYNAVNGNTIASAPDAGVTRSLIREEALGDAGMNSIQGNTFIVAGALSVGPLDCQGAGSIIRGNIGAGTAGDSFGALTVKEGTNARMGTAVLVGGVVTVPTTAVNANSRIFLTIQTPGGTPGAQWVSARTPGTSFQITSSSAADTSTVAWWIVDPG